MSDAYFKYEAGLKRLLERLSSDHSFYADALRYQQRLQDNITQTRRYGDTETRRAERAQIVDALNHLALETVGISFNELCELARDESVLTTPTEPAGTSPPPSPSDGLPTEEPPARIHCRAWGLLALLVLDFCLVIPWGWCLFGDQPNLMAFLQTIFTIVGVLLAILAILFVMRRPIALEDALHRLGIDRGWACIILGLSGLIIVTTFLFWPLGWVGKCGPTPVPVPTSTPTSASTLTPTPITATPTSTATVVHLTDARVHFTVVLSDDVEQEIHVGGILTLRPGDAALITVSVTVNQSPFPRLLAYNYFAPRRNIPEEHTGPSASYVAPEQPGPDIITVQITDLVTGDTILRSIKVVVDKKSP